MGLTVEQIIEHTPQSTYNRFMVSVFLPGLMYFGRSFPETWRSPESRTERSKSA